MLSLFGLAPDGVYLARSVTGPAVSSYLTLSPLPEQHKVLILAVYFLRHFPLGRPSRVLPGIVFSWSPDFPPLRLFKHCSSDHPADWQKQYMPHLPKLYNQSELEY